MKSGYVYLICENGDNELFKIGVTCGNVEDRIKKLQTGNGNKLICIKSFYSDNPYRLEKMLHGHFSQDREEGEWFLLSKEQVESFTSICELYQKNIDALKDNPFF